MVRDFRGSSKIAVDQSPENLSRCPLIALLGSGSKESKRAVLLYRSAPQARRRRACGALASGGGLRASPRTKPRSGVPPGVPPGGTPGGTPERGFLLEATMSAMFALFTAYC